MQRIPLFHRLNEAFDEGHKIRTGGGKGLVRRRQVADIVLPTGELTMGYPGIRFINDPSDVHPIVDPGRYRVFMSVAEHPSRHKTFAFLTVIFSAEPVAKWESAGRFFTDSGDGCVFDRSLTEALRHRVSDLDRNAWRKMKVEGVERNGDCSLLLEEKSGNNAIIFRTLDWRYDCYIGKGKSNRPVCLVVDGRWVRWWDAIAFWR